MLGATPSFWTSGSGAEPENLQLSFTIPVPGDTDATGPRTVLGELLAQDQRGSVRSKGRFTGRAERRSLILERGLNGLCAVRGGTERGI